MTRVAFFTPIYPQKTGVADWTEEILPYMSDQLEIDLFVDRAILSNIALSKKHRVYSFDDFDTYHKEYDVIVYQIGNSNFHIKIYDFVLQYPGILILHDYAIHHMVAAKYLNIMKDDCAYIEEVIFNHGVEAGNEALRRIKSGEQGLWETDAFDYPMNRRMISNALGIVVFSAFTRKCIEDSGWDLPIHRINLHCGGDCRMLDASVVMEEKEKLKLKLEPDEALICVFGFISTTKRPFSIFEAFHQCLKAGKKATLVFVGELKDDCTGLSQMVRRYKLEDKVKFTGYTTKETFLSYLYASDICISLRYPTMGETSAVLMRAMSIGKPSIVTDVGSFQELDSDAVIKIGHGETEIDELTGALCRLLCDKIYAKRIAENAFRYAKNHLQIEDTANSLVGFIKQAGIFTQIQKNDIYISVKERFLKRIRDTGAELHPDVISNIVDNLVAVFKGEMS